jgi:tetratricopeptide (TPR) repeat protein
MVLGCAAHFPEGPELTGPASLPVSAETTGYSVELLALDGRIRSHNRRAESSPRDWMIRSGLADLHMTRGRLSGDYDDYASAEVQVAMAFAIAPTGSGPFLTRARLNFALHRLDRVEPDLDSFEQRIRITDAQAAQVALIRANLDAQRGQLDTAIAGAALARSLDDTPGARSSLAMMYRAKGQWDRAEALLDSAEADYHGISREPLAWIALHRGILDLDRGRYREAAAHYSEAAKTLDGWWLIDEHIAEIRQIQGDLDLAEGMYLDIVARTGKPEFMDALATIAARRGDLLAAAAWHEAAHGVFETQLDRYPEAAAGHVLEHFLDDGAAHAAQALRLARENAKLRPNGEALTLLARAYMGVDEADAATEAVEAARATGYVSADLFAIRTAVLRRMSAG